MTIHEFQFLIERTYLAKDSTRGLDGTFRWFVEEVGELARGIRHKDRPELTGEFADVLAWLASLASQCGIDLEQVVLQKYGRGCPKCFHEPCICREIRRSAHCGSKDRKSTTGVRRKARVGRRVIKEV